MPYVPPKSMQFTQEDVDPAFKARVHLQRAEDLKEPHFRYLELWKGFEFLYRVNQKSADKLTSTRAPCPANASEMEIIASTITTLSRPRLEHLLAMKELPELNAALCRKNMKRILGDNELLSELGMNELQWQTARRDLQFNLKANYHRAAGAMGRLLLIVRGAADPKVRKTDNVVSDEELLGFAYELLKYVVKHLVEHELAEHDDFMSVQDRKATAEKALKAKREAMMAKHAKKA